MGKKSKEQMKKGIRIVLVDDHELERRGLRGTLEAEKDMQVVGEYGNAEEAFPEVARLSPDIVLMDIELPGMNGIEATRRLKRDGQHCNADVIILGESADGLAKALGAGAAGYLLKDIKRAELTQGIREVYQNRHSLEEHEKEHRDVVGEAVVDLVVPPSVKAAHLVEFTDQLEKTLDAKILFTVGSWDWGVAITIQTPKPMLLANLLDRLRDIPDVEKAEEPRIRNGFHSFLKKFRIMSRSRTSLRKRILVSLKQRSVAKQGLATALG